MPRVAYGAAKITSSLENELRDIRRIVHGASTDLVEVILEAGADYTYMCIVDGAEQTWNRRSHPSITKSPIYIL